MEKDIQKILKLLENKSESDKMDIIAECAKKVGTAEWKEEVEGLMKRMRMID